ncbi:MAG: hypothetical protein Q8K63_14450 [Acidimicrobiales bacterium]|nr:hypothetical protein [Acidimicrobiales bacterium]
MAFVFIGLAVYFFVRSRRSEETRPVSPEVDAVGWVTDTNWRVVGPLARVETRRLLLHPAFVFGLVFSLLTLSLATVSDSAGTEWVGVSGGVALGLAPLGWFAIAAVHLLTTRPRRTGADGLFASLPAPQPTRSAALLATMVGAFGVASALAAGFVAYRYQADWILGDGPDYLEILAGPLLIAGGVAVGVAIGRYLPHPLFGAAGAIAVIFIQLRLGTPTSWPWMAEEAHPVRMLGFVAQSTAATAVLEFRPAGWHLVYLVALIVVMALVALARDGVTRPLAGGLAVAVVSVGVAGWMQTRPAPPSTVAAMVRYLEEPMEHLDCAERDAVRYCVAERGTRELPVWQARVRDLRALAPAAFVGRTLEVTERVPTVIGNQNCSPQPYTDSLVAAVAKAIDPAKVWPAGSAVHPGIDTMPCSSTSVHGFFFATQVGSWAVGLPPSPHGLDQRCRADGRARAALALWLAAKVSPQGRATLRDLVAETPGASHLVFPGWNHPPMWGVEFAVADAQLALRLLDTDATAEKVRAAWDRVVDPATSSEELAVIAGVVAPSGVVATGRTACG